MIYQPRNVYPSASAIDVTENNTFSMEIQTNTSVTAYGLYLYNFDNSSVYSTSKTVLSEPLYNGDILNISVPSSLNVLSNGLNYKWKVRLYQSTADMLITYGFVQQTSTTTVIYTQPNINVRVGMNLVINGVSKAITAYNIDTGATTVASAYSSAPTIGTQYKIYSDFIDTVPDYIFYARQTPTVSVSAITDDTLTTKYYTFTGNYTQSDGVPIVYHKFDLYSYNSDGEPTLIDSSGKIYSAKLEYTYDAFRTGNTYMIQMTVENNMGIVSQTEPYIFDVEYEIIEYLQQPSAVFDEKRNAINVTWATPVEHEGRAIDAQGQDAGLQILYNVPFNGVNSLYTEGYEVLWEDENGIATMPDDYNITLQFSPNARFFYNEDGVYSEEANIIEGHTDEDVDFAISIDKNKLIFTIGEDTLETPFYSGTTQVFVNSDSAIVQPNYDYVWLDTGTWNDSGYWVEGGTSLQRVCNHWWKAQITNNDIRVQEIAQIQN